MKEFKINEQQLQQLWNVLIEFPAKSVMHVLDLIRNLPVLEVVSQDNPPPTEG